MFKSLLGRRNHLLLATVLAIAAYAAYVGYYTFFKVSHEQRYLFVIDDRADKTQALTLSDVFTKEMQKRTETHIHVQVIQPNEIVATYAELETKYADRLQARPTPPPGTEAEREKEYEQLRRETQSSKLLFIELNPPYSVSKKALRQEIDQQRRYIGRDRVLLLNSIVPVLRHEPYLPAMDCGQLIDDFAYMQWQFHAVGLHVNEAAIALLKTCQPHW